MDATGRARERAYARVAPVYETLAQAWSLGAIGRSREWGVAALPASQRLLFVGSGQGVDALAAARAGHEVHVLDECGAMLAAVRARFARAGLRCTTHRADLFHFEVPRAYDAVAAHFVLNVFDAPAMALAIARVAGFVEPGGRLLVADFAAPAERAPVRALQWLHYAPVALAGAALGLAPLHGLYDYERALEAIGWRVLARRRFGGFYEALVAQRADD